MLDAPCRTLKCIGCDEPDGVAYSIDQSHHNAPWWHGWECTLKGVAWCMLLIFVSRVIYPYTPPARSNLMHASLHNLTCIPKWDSPDLGERTRDSGDSGERTRNSGKRPGYCGDRTGISREQTGHCGERTRDSGEHNGTREDNLTASHVSISRMTSAMCAQDAPT